MIRFKCIYCGQRILAPDNGTGKKGKCPKCKHSVVVPKTTAGRPAINPDISEQTQRAREAAALSSPAFMEKPESDMDRGDEKAELIREKAGWFIPTYDELSVFLLAVTFILVFSMNGLMRRDIYTFIREFDDPRVFFFILMFVGALGLCLYHVFTTREKTQPEKTVMLAFAVVTNGLIGLAAAKYMVENSEGWLLLFPVWNAINSALLLLMWRFRIIDERCFIDRNASSFQVIFGLMAILVIFIFCNYIFKLYWAITFSICIVYTTSFDRALQSVFPGLAYSQNIEQKEVQRKI
ncbi:MAG: hypothetical protein JW749_07315 [Sedimentisphaerales bacterium]|nr:hypothetical protein [Sedimentisphaerales bacterium]